MSSLDSVRQGIAELAKLTSIGRPRRCEWNGFLNVTSNEHDNGRKRFNGASIPIIRRLAKVWFSKLSLEELQALLESNLHEERVFAVLCLVLQYPKQQDAVYEFYLSSAHRINHWDMINISAYKICGEYLRLKDRSVLMQLADSQWWCKRRIGITATFNWIRRDNDFEWTLRLAARLKQDSNNYVRDGVQWMLREVGKKDPNALTEFLRDKS